MTVEEFAPDKHQALKLENNRAIKLAALALAEERGLGQFTVEELATRAQVSRRTFFNHFGSIHEATRAGLRDILFDASEAVIDALRANTELNQVQTAAELFEVAAASLQAVDFTPSIVRMHRVLGIKKPGTKTAEDAQYFGEVFAMITAEIRELLSESAPHLPNVTRNLLVDSLLASVRITAEIWLPESASLKAPAAMARWQELHAQAIGLLRNGFAAN
jgi:TetR/AcrR family transcriptional regulator, regulator of autoinduction and epiphytic fitness